MKLGDLPEYRRNNPSRVPACTVIAYAEPLKPGFVVQYDRWNLVVERELTREEFMEALRANRQQPDAVTGEAELDGSRLDMDAGRDAGEPGPEYKYFYLMRRLR